MAGFSWRGNTGRETRAAPISFALDGRQVIFVCRPDVIFLPLDCRDDYANGENLILGTCAGGPKRTSRPAKAEGVRRMPENADTVGRHRAAFAAVGLALVIGGFLRFHNLGGESLWVDEAVSWTQAKDGLADLIWRAAHDNYPPLHNLALFAVIKLFGDSEWSLRLPSAIFGVANIGVLYWLGTMTFGRAAGLLGAALLAVAPFHIWYSQEARMYSLLALAATLFAATCFHYLRAPSFSRCVWTALAGLALVYSHPYGALDWVAIAVAFRVLILPSTPLPPRATLIWKVSNVVIGVGFAPWALILAYRAHVIAGEGFWIPPLTAGSLGTELEKVAGGWLFAGVILTGVVLGVVGRMRRDVMVLCIWIVVPVATGIMASILSTPAFLPPLLLLSAFGWTKYAKDWRGAILSIAVLALAGLYLLFNNPYENVTIDSRDVASFLDEREQPSDCVLVVPGYHIVVHDYYRRKPSCQWGAMKVADLPAEMRASVLFVIFVLRDVGVTASTQALFIDELRRRGWREAERADFPRIQMVIFSR
jgi:mannosyltransferase